MANSIAKFRKAVGLTQKEAADKLGWSQGRWSGYETGYRTPDADDIRDILSVLHGSGATFESLFLSDEDEADTAAA